MDKDRTHRIESYPEHRRSAGRNPAIKTIVIAAVVLLAALWIWKAVQIHGIRKEARQETERVKQAAAEAVTQNSRDQLAQLMKPFVWAVRSEMIRGNMEQVNLYMADMVREKNFRQIQIANPEGVVVASTNKKDEGKPLADAGRSLQGDSTVVQNLGDSLWVISSPIMGLNARLGTLVIDYNKPRTQL